MLISSKKILQEARDKGFAVPQFNAATLEAILAIAKAAQKAKTSVIIGTSEGEIAHSSEKYLSAMVKEAADSISVPLVLHLDHGSSLEQIKKCIDAGYTSVHIDASAKEFEENIKLTKEVVEYAHKKDVQVEGELGKVLTPKSNNDATDRSEFFTDPEKVEEFVEKTGIDSLAISIGTAHGAYKGDTKIDFERLKEIATKTEVPLVLHGASMIPDEDIKKAIGFGISKININTELRLAYSNSLRETLEKHPEEYIPHYIFKDAIEEMRKVCEDKLELFSTQKIETKI